MHRALDLCTSNGLRIQQQIEIYAININMTRVLKDTIVKTSLRFFKLICKIPP